MTIGDVLHGVLDILDDIHVLGKESAKLSMAMDHIRAVIHAVEASREEGGHEDRNEQGKSA